MMLFAEKKLKSINEPCCVIRCVSNSKKRSENKKMNETEDDDEWVNEIEITLVEWVKMVHPLVQLNCFWESSEQ